MKRITFGLAAAFITLNMSAFSQTNVFDDVIVPSPNHTYLEAAIIQEGLQGALQNNSSTLTVFAPTDAAFTDLANALGTDITGLLALPNLTDILTYHVLGSTVPASGVTNGAVVQPLSMTNTLKLTLTGTSEVYVNQAQVTTADINADNGVVHVIDAVVLPGETVVDIALDSPDFNSLTAAVIQEELLPVLTDPLATLTVFAPTDAAFTDIATALGTDIAGLLALPNLTDILTYHVLGSEVLAGDINNGDIVQPVSTTNTLKMTVTSGGMVYANQAQVTTADLMAENGAVHVLDAVVLPSETVVDIALDSPDFNSLTAAVIQEELLPVLTDPVATLTVFAPTDAAFTDIATGLGTDIAGLLALPNLTDILTYHVLGSEVLAGDINNGDIVQPVSTTNTLKMTVTSGGMVYANQAQVTTADLMAENGAVHVLDAVVLPSETVVDIALDSPDFNSLTAAVIQEELLPALTDPLATLTVFAPTDAAFDALALALGTDINGVLANPELTDILLYHVLGSTVLSTDLTNGSVPTLNGQSVTVDLSSGVMINSSTVTTADLASDNGVVHVIDAVLLPSLASIDEGQNLDFKVYPNPATDMINIDGLGTIYNEATIFDLNGRVIQTTSLENNTVNINTIESGSYILGLRSNDQMITQKIQIF
jgi:transforming growth factor-beta-induced protein